MELAAQNEQNGANFKLEDGLDYHNGWSDCKHACDSVGRDAGVSEVRHAWQVAAGRVYFPGQARQ